MRLRARNSSRRIWVVSYDFPKNTALFSYFNVDSVIILYRSYPGDPGLQEYLEYAIQDGILSVATFVSTLLRAAQSPELHDAETLDTLVRIALDAHYSSGLSPVGSVVPYSESTAAILDTIQDALALLRIAHSLPIAHFHQIITSASELLILLMSCVPELSSNAQISSAQAMLHFSNANNLLNSFALSSDVKHVLDNSAMNLSLLIGDDTKAVREAQMLHSLQQQTFGKGDILGPNSNTDIVTFGLELHHLVSDLNSPLCCLMRLSSGVAEGQRVWRWERSRHCRHICSNIQVDSLILLISFFSHLIYRWTSWTPTVFYTQLLLSSFISLSQSSPALCMIWKAFVVGRVRAKYTPLSLFLNRTML